MGTLVVSLEAELAWGFPRVEPPPEDLDGAREGWQRALDAFDRHGVPATWAVVGHLFLDDCPGDHADHPGGTDCCQRPVGDVSARDAWFGDGLVEAVRRADVDHEVAGHGFTHVPFDDRLSRPEALRRVEWMRRAAERRGYDLSSFVFPADRPAHREALAGMDFDCYRGPAPTDRSNSRDRRRRSGSGDTSGTPPLVRPRVDERGLVQVPTSAYLFDPEGSVYPLVGSDDDPLTDRAVRGVDEAAGDDGVVHFSLHPRDLTTDRAVGRLDAVLDRAATLRDRGTLELRTMGGVAAGVRDEQLA